MKPRLCAKCSSAFCTAHVVPFDALRIEGLRVGSEADESHGLCADCLLPAVGLTQPIEGGIISTFTSVLSKMWAEPRRAQWAIETGAAVRWISWECSYVAALSEVSPEFRVALVRHMANLLALSHGRSSAYDVTIEDILNGLRITFEEGVLPTWTKTVSLNSVRRFSNGVGLLWEVVQVLSFALNPGMATTPSALCAAYKEAAGNSAVTDLSTWLAKQTGYANALFGLSAYLSAQVMCNCYARAAGSDPGE